jgi:hypothetical protein
MIIYISGPITGIKDNNRDAFFKMETRLRNHLKKIKMMPCEIINPLRIASMIDRRKRSKQYWPRWEDYMRACLRELCRSDFIIFLPGSENSKGATLEKEVAEKLKIDEMKLEEGEG